MLVAPKILALYAAVLAVMYVFLTIRVIKVRVAIKASLGDGGGDMRLIRAIRAHGNFAEFVPFALLLIALAEMNGTPALFVHVLGAVLVVARLSHAYAVSSENENIRFRQIGMMGTFLVLIGAAVHAVVGG